MQKGIVLELDKKWTVVLTPDGQFCKVPTQPHYTEGMEITFQPATISQVKHRLGSPRLIKTISAMAACILLLLCIIPFTTSKEAYAAVTIDINPSLEIDADKQGNVMDVIPLNADAKEIITNLQWKKKKVSDVTLEIINAAESKGLMNSQQQVIITTTFYKQEDGQQEQWDTMLEDTASKADPNLTVVVVDGNKEWAEEAKKQNVTLGSYSVAKQAEQQGIHIPVDDIQKGKIEDLSKVHGIQVIYPKKKKGERPAFQSKQESNGDVQKNDDQINSTQSEDQPSTKIKQKEEDQKGKLEDKVQENDNLKNQYEMRRDQGSQDVSNSTVQDQENRSREDDQRNKGTKIEKDKNGDQFKGKKDKANRDEGRNHGEGNDHRKND